MSIIELPPVRTALERSWSVEDAAELYQIQDWGKGYFAVDGAGHVVVRPDAYRRREVKLLEIVEAMHDQGLTTPLLIRFSDLLAHRLQHLHRAFTTAIRQNDYAGRYVAVYPIKVNQQRPVVEEIHRHGQPFGFGLEVGSKPELLAVMALTDDTPERLIICNGFKDRSYLEAVILATKLGRNIIPVVEKASELALILR